MAQKEVTQPIMKLAQVAFESERPQVLPNPYDETDLKEEEGRGIPGWEGLYQVSTHGRIKSFSKCKERPRILSPLFNNGYQAVILTHKNKRTGEFKKYFAQIHLMMAKAFLPNPEPEYYCQVNHRSGRSFNLITNLEGCTAKYNNLYNDKAKTGGLRKMRLAMYFVKLTNVQTGEEKIVNSTRDAATFIGTHINLINLALRNMYSSGHNVIRGWRVELTDKNGNPVEDEQPKKPIVCTPYDAMKASNNVRIIQQYDKEGNLLNEFKNLTEAEKETGVWKSNISKALLGGLNTAGGFVWKYKEN